MTPQDLDSKFQQLLQALPAETEALARHPHAFHRGRRIKMAFNLLRAVLLYSVGDLSLREIAGWFTGRGQRLTSDRQREENRVLARVRVKVEHGIRRVKGFRVVREKYRLALGLFPMVASAVVGLAHLNRSLM